MNKTEIITYLKNLSFIFTSLLFFIFPVFFLLTTSDVLTVPKQSLIIFGTIVLSLLLSIRMLVEQKLTFKITPINIPVLIFGIVILVSSLFSLNRYDSVFQTVPVLFSLILFFVVINTIEDKTSFKVVLFALMGGAALAALFSISSYFKVYLLPFPATKTQFFNTLGSYLQQLVYFVPILVLALSKFAKGIKERKFVAVTTILSGVFSFILISATALIVYQMAQPNQMPLLLPYVYGFQVALSTISQDSQRFILSLLLGSGYGTFSVDFTRFRLASFNLEKDIWSLPFPYSSSYVLELIATTGIAGLLSFLLLTWKIVKTGISSKTAVFSGVLVALVLLFILPMSFTTVTLFVFLLALFASNLFVNQDKNSSEVVLSLVAFKKGLINIVEEGHSRVVETPVLPIIMLVLSVLIYGGVSFYASRFLLSDMKITQSLTSENLNNGQKAYDLQKEAIGIFPYRSEYYRAFSQLNFALANSLASAQAGKTIPEETQNTILALIQQSIEAGKASTTISPMTSSNWVNLSQIYRNLIKVGQNAEQFAVLTASQAINLDPSNPQLYIELGGIYYQLGQYDLAQNQFQLAVNLKRDLANGYYNLGHALEQKGDLAGALSQYRVVQSLVTQDKANYDRVTEEINAISGKIQSNQKAAELQQAQASQTQQPPLELSQPSNLIPTPQQPVEIPGPINTPAPSPTPGN